MSVVSTSSSKPMAIHFAAWFAATACMVTGRPLASCPTKVSAYIVGKIQAFADAMGANRSAGFQIPTQFDAGAGYGVVHQTGGAMAGADPGTRVVNKYQQSWDVPNLFVIGASSFPQVPGVNPTGHVSAHAFYTADAIKNKYKAKPGPLV